MVKDGEEDFDVEGFDCNDGGSDQAWIYEGIDWEFGVSVEYIYRTELLGDLLHGIDSLDAEDR